LRKHAKQPAHELLARGAERTFSVTVRKPRWTAIVAILSAAAALAIVGWALASGNNVAGPVFFGAGAMLLLAGICAAAALLNHLSRAASGEILSASAMGLRSATRRRPRSVATIALLAAGSFMIIAIAANRLDAEVDAHKRTSGTGGFALIGETALPVFHDLNTADGQDFFGLNAPDLQGTSFVPMRVRRLLGGNPDALKKRGAFAFSQALTTNNWSALLHETAPGEVPAIGDANSIKWALGKNVGDTLDYIDEQGRPFKIRIVGSVANSVLQGSLLIDERAFMRRFPGEAGYRMFLIDAPSNTVSEVSATLSRALQDVGLELTPAVKRLAEFNAVQNTYLNTFQVLGGLGLLIGTAGLGVVVLRNVLERRGEFGLLLALGYPRRLVRRIVLSEHIGLLAAGLCIGVIAALSAIAPFLFFGREGLPVTWLAITLGSVVLVGLFCTILATWSALRGNLLTALRNE
jgi:putative ABC transport system permease protein